MQHAWLACVSVSTNVVTDFPFLPGAFMFFFLRDILQEAQEVVEGAQDLVDGIRAQTITDNISHDIGKYILWCIYILYIYICVPESVFACR